MATVQCDNFVGNAWKKDLCLNCFRSKEEHKRNGICQQQQQQQLVPTRILDPPKEGILKGTKSRKSRPKGSRVIFSNDEFEVIGFGGDDSYSDDDSIFNGPAEVDGGGSGFDQDETEEEKSLQKLTKSNTDFNSVPENLREPKEGQAKKIVEPLRLGKQVFDEKGNRKTLLVSVTPFVDQTAVKNRINANGIKSDPASNVDKSRKVDDDAGEVATPPGKNTAERTEETNLEKSGERMENTLEIGQSNGVEISGRGNNERGQLKRSQPLDKNFKFRLTKDFQKENERNSESSGKEPIPRGERIETCEKGSNLVERTKRKIIRFPVIADNSNFKLKTKDLNSVGRKMEENDGGVVLDIYDIREREEGKANGNETVDDSKRNPSKENGTANPMDVRVKFDGENGSDTGRKWPSPKIAEVVAGENSEKRQNGSTIDRSKLIPNVSSLHRHHPKKNSISTVEERQTFAMESVEPLTNGIVKGAKEEDDVAEGVRRSGMEDESKSDSTSEKAGDDAKEREESKFKKFSFGSIENFDKIMSGEEIILFSAEMGMEEKNGGGEMNGEQESKEVEEAVDDGISVAPPALPTKPPPSLFESRGSLLHESTPVEDESKTAPDKPKVPAKPILIQSKRINFQSPINAVRPKSPSTEKFLDLTGPIQVNRPHFPSAESPNFDCGKNQKRHAPKPPSPKEEFTVENGEFPGGIMADLSIHSPESEKETNTKRMSRSTENLLNFIADREEREGLRAEDLEEISISDGDPRRSLSQDNLSPCDVGGDGQTKKKVNRGKFFLQKILHLGKTKETCKEFNTGIKPKLKLEIIHPSDLNGSRVEVVPAARTFKGRRSSSSASSSSGEQRECDVLSDSSTSHSVSSYGNDSSCANDRPKKPPPPPRAPSSSEVWNQKPARPPPPKSIEILRQNNSSWFNAVDTKSDSHYVNLGEARSGLAPNKPLRTGSLRETTADTLRKSVTVTTQPEDSDYESFVVSSASPVEEDNLYECVETSNHRSSLPECDSLADCQTAGGDPSGNRRTGSREMTRGRSEGDVDLNSDSFIKMKYLRSVSLPYCASETESEIYSPYSFYGSELGEEDYEMSSSNQLLRMSRLKHKKGRSIVHKNLEDNYGAVIVANHEALAQVAEQMRQGPAIPPALRLLSTAGNLRWTDFAIPKDAAGVVVERRIFYPALWGTQSVTLSLMAEQCLNSSLHAKGPFNLNPIAELNDLVPASYLPMLKRERKDSSELIQASISVLVRLKIETIETYGRNARSGVQSEESKKEVNFVLLQIVNAFKSMQAEGIEEVSKNLTNLVICHEEKDPHPRICIVDSFERSDNRNSLCQCLIRAIEDILPPTDLTPLISRVLLKEKAISLSQAKGILEFTLWGPADISFGNSSRERESALQRWLDLERATVLHGLVRTRAELTVFEEWQLLFLVKTTAKMLAKSSLLLENGIGDDVAVA